MQIHRIASEELRQEGKNDGELCLSLIQKFIRQSFQELIEELEKINSKVVPEHMMNEWRAFVKGETFKPCPDLESVEMFRKSYGEEKFKIGEGGLFYATVDGKVAGIIGCTSNDLNTFELELIRLFVPKEFRGKGVAKQLVDTVVDYGNRFHYALLFLYCGNQASQAFYKRFGFTQVNMAMFYLHLRGRDVNTVCISGGVHGNELIGPTLINNHETFFKKEQYETFSLSFLLANPKACKQATRYVEHDLNRCFGGFDLDLVGGGQLQYEFERAREINQILGPKHLPHPAKKVKYLIDCHSTTSNMGISLICIGRDMLTFQMFCALKKTWNHPDVPLNLIIETGYSRKTNNNIDSVPSSGVCVEVGALPHGTLGDLKLLNLTHHVCEFILNYIETANKQRAREEDPTAKRLKRISYPTLTPDVVDAFECVDTIKFPKNEKGVIIGAIHPALLGSDFKELKKNDPLFVSIFNQSNVIETFAGSKDGGDVAKMYPIFIGEAAYYHAEIAMVLCKKITVMVL